MADSAPLLESAYVEGCSGCEVDRRKASRAAAPYREFVCIGIVTLCATLPISSLFPFLYFMIRDLHIAKTEEDIGYYAGYVGSSFMFGRALTSALWGIIADRYGRKPVIVLSIFAVIIFNTLFGLSTSFWMAISTRFLLGVLSGLLGPIKAYCSEICRPEHQSIALSLVSTSWGIGLIIGPAIGGYLAQPAEKYPQIFSNYFFLRFPYFLPCLSISLVAVCASVACFWLPETLHKHKTHTNYRISEDLESYECCKNLKERTEEIGDLTSKSKTSLLKNWPLMSSIIVYCIFSLHDMGYTEVFSLWAESDKKYGGLSFLTEDVGQVLAITGFSLLVFQLSLYPKIERLLGPILSSRLAALLSIPLLSVYPLFTKLSGIVLKLVVNVASLLKNLLSTTVVTGLFIMQNNAVEQNQRGAANGIAMTLQSIFKAVAPTGAGSLFAFAQKRQNAPFLPGDQLVFVFLCLIQLVGVISTFEFFLKPRTM